MASDDLAELDTYAEGLDAKHVAGTAFLLRWLFDGWGDAAKSHIMMQFAYFYIFLLIGFLFLWLMLRSTARLQEIKRSVGEALRAQRERRFDGEGLSMYG